MRILSPLFKHNASPVGSKSYLSCQLVFVGTRIPPSLKLIALFNAQMTVLDARSSFPKSHEKFSDCRNIGYFLRTLLPL